MKTRQTRGLCHMYNAALSGSDNTAGAPSGDLAAARGASCETGLAYSVTLA
jgi:hypothetical protein